MLITYLIHEDGGFTCGDRQTTRTAYAYPTSPNAERAKRFPEKVAREMLQDANTIAKTKLVREYDRRHWYAMFLSQPSRAVDVEIDINARR